MLHGIHMRAIYGDWMRDAYDVQCAMYDIVPCQLRYATYEARALRTDMRHVMCCVTCDVLCRDVRHVLCVMCVRYLG